MALHENLQLWLDKFVDAIPKESVVNQLEEFQNLFDAEKVKVAKLEAQTVTMCAMLDGVTTSISKTDTVHALTCIKIDEFLEKEFNFFTRSRGE
jgi:hypothetical protein